MPSSNSPPYVEVHASPENSPRKRSRTEQTMSSKDHYQPVTGRHRFDTLPFELLAEILIFTNYPGDVLAVARTSKFFCSTLLNPISDYIWKTVRKNCSAPPPSPMCIFTEASYAAFLYGGGPCEVCKKHTEEFYCSFGIRLRLCHNPKCKSDWVQNGNFSRLLPQNEEIYQCIPYIEDNRCFLPTTLGHETTKIFRESDLVRESVVCVATQDDHSKMNINKIAFIPEYMKFCKSLNEWKETREALYRRNETVNNNMAEILAASHGYVLWDMMNSTLYGVIHRLRTKRIERVSNEDFLRVADKVETSLIRLSESRERRGREAKYSQNRLDIAEHYQRLRSKQPRIVLPPLDDFRRLPIIKILQGTSPATVEYPTKEGSLSVSQILRKEAWVVERLNTELRQWREEAKKDLSVVLGFPNWKTASSTKLHPVERLSARFLCKVCDSKLPSRYRTDGCLDFVGVCAHVCPTERKEASWTVDNFVRDDKATVALKRFFTLCHLDESCYDRSFQFMNAIKSATIMCTSCQPALVMNLSCVVGHCHRHENMEMRILTRAEATFFLHFPFIDDLVHCITGSDSRRKAIRAQANFGCRHCFNANRQLENRTSIQPRPAVESVPAPETDTVNHVGITADKDKQGEKTAEPKHFSFPGITSHLKEKHGIDVVKDEDIFVFDATGLLTKSSG